MAKRTPAPDWLPDWKGTKGYPMINAPIMVWRWQFLRRRADYQRDFARLPDSCETVTFLNGRGTLEAVLKPAAKAMMRKYGVAQLLDPATPACYPEFFPRAPAWNVHSSPGRQFADDLMGFIRCRIDLAEPISDQLRFLKPHLEAEQKKRGFDPTKRERSKWLLYLRVLDAYASGASPHSIGSYLHEELPAKSTVSRWHAAARKQQDRLTLRAV